jgi:dihydroxyacetone kinase-like protein
MTEATIRDLIDVVARRVIAAAEELTDLDRQIGDGDHGSNMRLAAQALLDQSEQIAAKPLPETLKAIGNLLMIKVGGAAGPLYGTFFITMGRCLGQEPEAIAPAFEAAVSAVMRMGKSEAGCKTMLDVLVPVQALLTAGGPDLPTRIKGCAAEAVAATVQMRATRGRAAFIGERSKGHMDPGARSTQLILTAVCDVLEGP